jgi:hypothetical protein
MFAEMRVQGPGQGELNRTESSLQDFFGRGEAFVRQLIAENERLRSELSEAYPGRTPEAVPAAVMEGLVARIAELEAECEAARDHAGGGNYTGAGGHVGGSGYAGADHTQRIEQLENENYHLASMYVAGLQFHSARSLPDVIQTITEILLNFVGIGAFTVFVLDEERHVLFPLACEGGDIDAVDEVPSNDNGPITAMIHRGRPWTRGDPAYADDHAIMYLPLVSNRRLVAVLRLESFLAQKPTFEDNDYSLLSMISEHAGIAIETAWIRAHAKAVALQRQAVEHLVGA